MRRSRQLGDQRGVAPIPLWRGEAGPHGQSRKQGGVRPYQPPQGRGGRQGRPGHRPPATAGGPLPLPLPPLPLPSPAAARHTAWRSKKVARHGSVPPLPPLSKPNLPPLPPPPAPPLTCTCPQAPRQSSPAVYCLYPGSGHGTPFDRAPPHHLWALPLPQGVGSAGPAGRQPPLPRHPQPPPPPFPAWPPTHHPPSSGRQPPPPLIFEEPAPVPPPAPSYDEKGRGTPAGHPRRTTAGVTPFPPPSIPRPPLALTCTSPQAPWQSSTAEYYLCPRTRPLPSRRGRTFPPGSPACTPPPPPS